MTAREWEARTADVEFSKALRTKTPLLEAIMWKVQYKSQNAYQAWSTMGNYGSEQSALNKASGMVGKYFMVRVVSPSGQVVWSA